MQLRNRLLQRRLFTITILLSALLLFLVQPVAGKTLLPLLGGTPAAWTICLLFFQGGLLLGYSYVWLSTRWVPLHARVVVHLLLAIAAVSFLTPFGYTRGVSFVSPQASPSLWALLFLALNVGTSFLVLSATAPMIQDWYARTRCERPYFLYAASNAGSLAALIGYPMLIEPWLQLEEQHTLFRFSLLAVVAAITVSAAWTLRRGDRSGADASARNGTQLPSTATSPSHADRLRWTALALIPTTLLAGSTAHLSRDLAPIPLLWLVPLCLYLLTFIVAFSDRMPSPPDWVGRAACLVAIVLVFVVVSKGTEPQWLLVILHLFFLGAGSWIAHDRLARSAPSPRFVAEFYFWIALGGVLGTLISAVLAPALLDEQWEYPIAIGLACALRTRTGSVRDDRTFRRDLLPIVTTVLLVVGCHGLVQVLAASSEILTGLTSLIAFGAAAVWSYRWMPYRRLYTLCLIAATTSLIAIQSSGKWKLSRRSFFGIVRVAEVEGSGVRTLVHGTTIHGSQRLTERDQCTPMVYYKRRGPFGWLMQSYRRSGRNGRSVVIGLGTGSQVCYARPDEEWRMIEINPDVIEIAENPDWFTFLNNAPTEELEISLADGRIAIGEESDNSLSLVVIDAFSSDAVPIHMLTREAVSLYRQKLQPNGWLVLHISNRMLDLQQVVSDIARAEGLVLRSAEDKGNRWVVLARSEQDLATLDASRWLKPKPGIAENAWTDSYSSLFSILKW